MPKPTSHAPTARAVSGVSAQGQAESAHVGQTNRATPVPISTAASATRTARTTPGSPLGAAGSSGSRRWTTHAITMSTGTRTYTASHVHVTARVASGRSPSRWNRSRWTTVTTSVSVVNTNTAGTAIRASDQRAARAAPTSSATADQYDAPRNTAVIGDSIVQANQRSVRSGNT